MDVGQQHGALLLLFHTGGILAKRRNPDLGQHGIYDLGRFGNPYSLGKHGISDLGRFGNPYSLGEHAISDLGHCSKPSVCHHSHVPYVCHYSQPDLGQSARCPKCVAHCEIKWKLHC